MEWCVKIADQGKARLLASNRNQSPSANTKVQNKNHCIVAASKLV